MSRILLIASVVLGFLTALVPAEEESSNARNCRDTVNILYSVTSDIRAARTKLEAQLDGSLPGPEVSQEERKAILLWLAASFPPDSEPYPELDSDRLGYHARWLDHVRTHLEKATTPEIANSKLTQEFLTLLKKKEDFWDLENKDLLETSIYMSEEVWLSAKTPADFKLAADRLRSFKFLQPAGWGMAEALRRRNADVSQLAKDIPGQTGQRFKGDDAVEAFDAWLVMGSPEPLILPDPAKDLAGFRAAREAWMGLMKMRNLFILRPALVDRFADYDLRCHAEEARLRKQLDDLILSNASAAEFEKVLSVYGPVKPERPSFISQEPAEDQVGTTERKPILDYRDLLPAYRRVRREIPQPTEIKSPGDPDDIAFYRAWLKFRKAEEANQLNPNANFTSEIYHELLLGSIHVSWRVTSHLIPRIAQMSPWSDTRLKNNNHVADIPETGSPVEKVSAVLAQKPELQASLKAWEMAIGKRSIGPTVPKFESVRPSIQPNGPQFGTLRDQALLQLIRDLLPPGTPDVPANVPMGLRAALEANCRLGQLNPVVRLLAADSAFRILPPKLRETYESIAESLFDAEWQLKSKSPVKATYVNLLKYPESPATAQFALEKIKTLKFEK